MTATILGNYIVRPEEIHVTIGSITILKSGEQIPSKRVLPVLMDCQGCKRPIVDKREIAFARQTKMCFVCCTGDCLNFGHRWSCRTILTEQVDKAKHLILKYLGDRVEFRTQLFEGDYRKTELHWGWYPEDAFIRIGYHVFRFLYGLTKDEADEAFRVSIYEGWESLMRLTKPAWERWKEEREIRNPDYEHRVPRRRRGGKNLLVSNNTNV